MVMMLMITVHLISMMSVVYVMEMILHVQIVRVLQMVMLMEMNVVHVIVIPLMIVCKIVQEHGVVAL